MDFLYYRQVVSRQYEQDGFQIKFKRVENVSVKCIELDDQECSLDDCSYQEDKVTVMIKEVNNVGTYKCKIYLSDDRILSVPFGKHVICTVGKCCM